MEKATKNLTMLMIVLFTFVGAINFPLTAEASPRVISANATNIAPAAQKLPPYTTVVNKEKTSQNYLSTSTSYFVDDKVVLVIDIYYRLQKNGTYKAVYYNAASADGGISFSERDIADADNVIYVDDNNLGLEKGQEVWAEIQSLLDEVGYN